MRGKDIPLLTIHNALSSILHAATLALPSAEVHLEYRQGTYLSLIAIVPQRFKQQVIDQLNVGLIHGEYDYRIAGVSYSTSDPSYFQTITAWIDLCYENKDQKEGGKALSMMNKNLPK